MKTATVTRSRQAAFRWARKIALESAGMILQRFETVQKSARAVIDEGPEWNAHGVRGGMVRLWQPTEGREAEAADTSNHCRECGGRKYYLRIWEV
jgi:hypothetical protein